MIFRSRYSIGKVSKVSKKSVGARFQSRKRKLDKTKNILKKVIIFSTAVGFVLVCALCLVIFNITKTLPDVEAISTYIPAETTKIYSEDGVV